MGDNLGSTLVKNLSFRLIGAHHIQLNERLTGARCTVCAVVAVTAGKAENCCQYGGTKEGFTQFHIRLVF